MRDQQPLVSVLMTAFNRELFIAESIESVLKSCYKNFELIIVDDRSTDKTVQIIERYQQLDSRIKLYINDINLGDYSNRNKAASLAAGTYLKYLDSDDKINGDGLQYCVDQMEKYPDAGLGLYCPYNLAGRPSVCITSDVIIKDHFFKQHYLFIGPTGAIYNRQKFEAAGGFDTRFGVASDMYFNLKMAAAAPVVLLSYLFVFYREHDGQEKNNQVGYLKNGYLYLKESLEKLQLPLKKDEISFLHRKMKKRHALNIIKTLNRTKNFSLIQQVMKQTNFTFPELMMSLFK